MLRKGPMKGNGSVCVIDASHAINENIKSRWEPRPLVWSWVHIIYLINAYLV